MNPETAHAHIRHPETVTRTYYIRCTLYMVRRQQQFVNLETVASRSDIAQLIVNRKTPGRGFQKQTQI